MYPLKLTAALKEYIWGGERLKTEYGFSTDLPKVSEAWVLSCHKDGENLIQNGKYQGLTLSEAISREGTQCLGFNAQAFDYFPILIKLIDAKENLSIQVHPDDAYANRIEHQMGKTEAWLVLDCDENASLIYGFNKEITKEDFRASIQNDTVLTALRNVSVKKGDLFFIEAGTVHAIGKGILIAEIQQNSNVTYRVYDYGRLGNDGKARELHIEKAVAVAKCSPETLNTNPQGKPERNDGYTITKLIACSFFTVNRLDITSQAVRIADDRSFVSLLAIEGSGLFECSGEKLTLNKGESIFVPANSGEFIMKGNISILETRV